MLLVLLEENESTVRYIALGKVSSRIYLAKGLLIDEWFSGQ